MNLDSEVILSLALTSLIGLWLIWQTIKINSNIDIFQIVVNWFRDRPIILPSLFFLISPFFFAYIFQDLPNFSSADINKLTINNAISDKILEKILLILTTVTSFLIGNRFLEGFRKIQEEKKVARILVASIEGHLDYLRQINRELNGTILSKSQMENIENTINQIRKDYIYESALKSIGVLNIQYIDFISTYSRNLNCLLDTILNSYEQSFEMTTRDDKSNRHIPLHQLQILRTNIKRVASDGEQCINKINIEVLNK
jgi:hypothetical protein